MIGATKTCRASRKLRAYNVTVQDQEFLYHATDTSRPSISVHRSYKDGSQFSLQGPGSERQGFLSERSPGCFHLFFTSHGVVI